MLELLTSWFLEMGTRYGVNPLVFGGLYVGTTPLYVGALAWTVRNLRLKKSAFLPGALAFAFFVAAYLYLFVAGQNLPLGMYAGVACMTLAGAYCAYGKVCSAKANDEAARQADEALSSDTDWL